MSNETKYDVFDAVWNRLAGYQVFFNGWPRETLDGYKKRYDNALPDNLPVIPNYVAEYIEEVKQGETDLDQGEINIYGAIYGALEWDQASCKESDWIQAHSDEFARAWLDGYEIDNKS